MARPEGFEPPAYRFEACRSIRLSYGRVAVGDEDDPVMIARSKCQEVMGLRGTGRTSET
jgi:hypothetical protein